MWKQHHLFAQHLLGCQVQLAGVGQFFRDVFVLLGTAGAAMHAHAVRFTGYLCAAIAAPSVGPHAVLLRCAETLAGTVVRAEELELLLPSRELLPAELEA